MSGIDPIQGLGIHVGNHAQSHRVQSGVNIRPGQSNPFGLEPMNPYAMADFRKKYLVGVQSNLSPKEQVVGGNPQDKSLIEHGMSQHRCPQMAMMGMSGAIRV